MFKTSVSNEDYPIDVVVTWVDGSDPAWLEERAKYDVNQRKSIADSWNKGASRYRDWDTLRYWFRGIEQFCPWIRKVFFVTWGHYPEWLNLNCDRLVLVRHDDFIPAEYLPTFNSHTIEFNMHRIPDLSEHFLYFNDDVFVIGPVDRSDFFLHGKPCDAVGFNALSRNEYNKQLLQVNNVAVINRHFSKNDVIRSNFFKWFNPQYGTKQLRTLLLMPWPRFVGFYEHHTAYPFLRSTFEKLWDLEFDELDNTCRCKFRAGDNVTPVLIRDWQNVEGNFVPRAQNFRKSFGGTVTQEIVEEIMQQRHSVICVNDDATTDESFDYEKALLHEAFDCILPNQSVFEI